MKITTLWQINCQPQKHFKTLYPGIGKHLDKVQCKVYSKIPSKNRATFSSLVKGQFVLVCGTWTEMSASTACSRNCSSTVMRSHRPHMNSVSESYLLPKRTLQIAVSMQNEHIQNLWSERKGRGCKHNGYASSSCGQNARKTPKHVTFKNAVFTSFRVHLLYNFWSVSICSLSQQTGKTAW